MLAPDLTDAQEKRYNWLLNHAPLLKIGSVNKLLSRLTPPLYNGELGRAFLQELGIDYRLIGRENMPTTGAMTIVSNHPGGADVIASISALSEHRPDMAVLANKLICIEPVRDIVIPVNTLAKGRRSVDDTEIHEAYQAGKVVVFFAAGMNSRYNEQGKLRDRRWRTSFLKFAHEYNTPVHVMRISGKNSPLFYRVSKVRNSIKALANVPLENMFQLREMVRKQPEIRLYLSEEVDLPELRGPELPKGGELHRIADALYDFLYTMDGNHLTYQP